MKRQEEIEIIIRDWNNVSTLHLIHLNQKGKLK